jgi:flagellin-like protein
LRLSRGRKRVALSELIGTLIMVAITLIAGAAVFGFVNGQAGTAENSYAANAANNVNYLREHFVLVNVQFPDSLSQCAGTSPNRLCYQIAVSVYNNGNLALTLGEISITSVGTTSAGGTAVPSIIITALIANPAAPSITLSYKGISCGAGVPTSALSFQGTTPLPVNSVPPNVYTLTLQASNFSCLSASGPFLVGGDYQVQAIGTYGNVVTTQVTANG